MSAFGHEQPSVGSVQSVVFRKPPWTYREASKWLRDYNFTNSTDEDEKINSIRFRQKDPSQFSDYYSIKLKNGIVLVFGKN